MNICTLALKTLEGREPLLNLYLKKSFVLSGGCVAYAQANERKSTSEP